MVDYAREYFSKNMLNYKGGEILLFGHTIMSCILQAIKSQIF